MSNPAFSPDWLQQFTDPFALLGLSVAADERRILKRYRQLAKQLHPDVQRQVALEQRPFFAQVLPKLVNPAYQRLKHEKSRNEVLATLRFKVRRLSRQQQLRPTGSQSRALLNIPDNEVDLYYEQTLNQLCEQQYTSLENFEAITLQLSELNLAFLRRKMGEPVIREKRIGLMAPSKATASPIPAPGANPSGNSLPKNYAERHFKRAQDYLIGKNAQGAIQELKDALKLEPQNSNYHCLMGQAYLLNKLPGMAKVHFKQALRLNPDNHVAQKYLNQLGESQSQKANPSDSAEASPPQPSPGKRGLFDGIFSRR